MKIGIDLGGSHISVGVINDKGFVVEKVEKRLMSKEKKHIIQSIESYVIEQVYGFQKDYSISEIGIAIPGTIKQNLVVKSVNLGLINYPIVDRLKEELSLPIHILNDAKCAALAEYKYGSLKNDHRVVFLTLGTGIGGAVIINNKLLDTGELPGCEFGHMIIERNGILCACGKQGCFEKYASMKAFKDNLRRELGLTESTRGQELLDRLRKEETDPRIQKIVQEFIDYLSVGISNLINIFEPEVVGIGGSFVYFSDVLLPKLKENIITQQYLFNPREQITIVPAVLGNDAGMIGSVC